MIHRGRIQQCVRGDVCLHLDILNVMVMVKETLKKKVGICIINLNNKIQVLKPFSHSINIQVPINIIGAR